MALYGPIRRCNYPNVVGIGLGYALKCATEMCLRCASKNRTFVPTGRRRPCWQPCVVQNRAAPATLQLTPATKTCPCGRKLLHPIDMGTSRVQPINFQISFGFSRETLRVHIVAHMYTYTYTYTYTLHIKLHIHMHLHTQTYVYTTTHTHLNILAIHTHT